MKVLPVHYGHALGIVHNARYAVMLERALSAYWAPRGHTITDGRPTTSDVVHAVREFTIRYLAPIRGIGTVNVRFWAERPGVITTLTVQEAA